MATNYDKPRTHRDLYDPFEDEGVDPERSLHHILCNRDGIFVMVFTHYNTDDGPDFGRFHQDLDNGEVYVKRIDVVSHNKSLELTFLQTIKCYCPVLQRVTSIGDGVMHFEFIHPKF
jgi:hypothetical protein